MPSTMVYSDYDLNSLSCVNKNNLGRIKRIFTVRFDMTLLIKKLAHLEKA
ncbi:MAG: hypothetical protein ACK5AY_12945 [Bacteroidota bacterium]